MVINHPESLLNGNMTDLDSRNSKNEIEIDFKFKYLNEIGSPISTTESGIVTEAVAVRPARA